RCLQAHVTGRFHVSQPGHETVSAKAQCGCRGRLRAGENQKAVQSAFASTYQDRLQISEIPGGILEAGEGAVSCELKHRLHWYGRTVDSWWVLVAEKRDVAELLLDPAKVCGDLQLAGCGEERSSGDSAIRSASAEVHQHAHLLCG